MDAKYLQNNKTYKKWIQINTQLFIHFPKMTSTLNSKEVVLISVSHHYHHLQPTRSLRGVFSQVGGNSVPNISRKGIIRLKRTKMVASCLQIYTGKPLQELHYNKLYIYMY